LRALCLTLVPRKVDLRVARSILVVHADIAIRHLAVTNLQHRGYRVSTACGLEDALVAVADDSPDAILVDERAQDMVDALAANPMTRDIPVVTVGRSGAILPPPD
jgi:DNA-binding NtrC family response regulator